MAISEAGAYPPIPDKKFFTIGEAAALVATKPYILRYWEKQIGAPKALQRNNGRRYYSVADIERLRHIHRLIYREGHTAAGARKALGREEKRDDASAAGSSAAQRQSLRRELEKIIDLL